MANGIEAVATAETFPHRTWRLPSAVTGLLRFCRRKPLGALGGLCVLAMLVMAAGADVIAHYDYDESVPGARMQPPSAKFWMGTDNLSRDMWSRVVYGARISVTVGFATITIGTLVAAAVGISSAYVGGTYDIVVQRIVDAWMSFPYLVIILSLMAVLGPGLLNLILALSLLIAAGGARVIRGAALSVMQNPYLEAARAMGSGHLRIVLRYVLPNVMATILILATIGLGGVILAESSLSFLGFGVPPPYPSWGAMLSGSGRSYMYRAPWMAIWPGLAISLAVFGFNMLGDALRDVLDPRLRGADRAAHILPVFYRPARASSGRGWGTRWNTLTGNPLMALDGATRLGLVASACAEDRFQREPPAPPTAGRVWTPRPAPAAPGPLGVVSAASSGRVAA